MIVIRLTFLALLTLITPSLLARRDAPRLGTAGLVLGFAALMSLFCRSIAGPGGCRTAAGRPVISEKSH